MLSKNKIKFIQSLARKKNRDDLGFFVAEGEKLIQELIQANFKFHTIVATEDVIQKYSKVPCEKLETDIHSIKKISSLTTPQEIVAVVHKPIHRLDMNAMKEQLTIALDCIQDPGNLGTIIRLASWFGIKQIICSEDTVDCFNSKVVQATMGGIAHVDITYTKLPPLFEKAKEINLPLYGTFLEGDNIFKTDLTATGVIIMGNEGKGISAETEVYVDHKLLIPSFGDKSVESLNVSMATAIVCAEFCKRFN